MIVHLSGDLDIAAKDELRSHLEAASEKSDKVGLNLSQVQYADSTALGLFIALRNRLMERGGGVELIDPSPQVRKLLGYAGLDKTFVIVENA